MLNFMHDIYQHGCVFLTVDSSLQKICYINVNHKCQCNTIWSVGYVMLFYIAVCYSVLSTELQVCLFLD